MQNIKNNDKKWLHFPNIIYDIFYYYVKFELRTKFVREEIENLNFIIR